MQPPDFVTLFIAPLNDLGIPYMVTGAVAMLRRVRHDVGGVPVWVAPIEYVILRKLQWHRDGGGAARHLDDVRAMLRVSGEADRKALGDWVTRLGLEDEWRLVGHGALE